MLALLLAFFLIGCSGTTATPNGGSSSGSSQKQEHKEEQNKTPEKEEDEGNKEQAGADEEDPVLPSTKVSNLRVKKSDGSVTLHWENPDNDELNELVVLYGTEERKLEKSSESLSSDTTSYEIKGLTNGTLYFFAVKTVFAGNKEDVSNIVSAKPYNPSELGSLSSVEFAENMVIGWNLGNTLDASGYWNGIYSEGKKLEINWLPEGKKVYTTEAMIKTVHAAGFETIRIPVSWHTHMAQNTTDYKIDSAWMARVKEVVDWAYNDGMFVIINIHHDNNTKEQMASHPGFCLSEDTGIQNKSKAFIEKVWEQIATEFASYDNHLIFEVLNEPRCIDTAWEWGWYSSGEAATAKKYSDIITSYEQVGLDKIRSISGNENRFVMVPGYAASGTNQVALGVYTLPTDSATDKLLLSTHAYSPNGFALNADMKQASFDQTGKNDLNAIFSYLKTNYTDKGIGVVMGEASATDKNNTAERIKWAQYYFGKARDASIPVVLWDNCVVWNEGTDGAERHGHFDRKNLTWYQPELIKAMVEAAGGIGDSGYTPPVQGGGDENDDSAILTIFDPEYFSAPEGMEIITNQNGKKYLKLTIDGYNTSFGLSNSVDCTDKTKFMVECYAQSSSDEYQVVIGIKDSSAKDVASGTTMNPLKDSVSTLVGGVANGDDASQTKIVSYIQPMAQETTSGSYDAAEGIVFYIGKITAE